VKCNDPQHASPEESKGLKQRASNLFKDINTLEGIKGAAQLAEERQPKRPGCRSRPGSWRMQPGWKISRCGRTA